MKDMTIKGLAKLIKEHGHKEDFKMAYEEKLKEFNVGLSPNDLIDLVIGLGSIKGLNGDLNAVMDSFTAILESLDDEKIESKFEDKQFEGMEITENEIIDRMYKTIKFDKLKLDENGLFKNNSKNRQYLFSTMIELIDELIEKHTSEDHDTSSTKIKLSEEGRKKVKDSKEDNTPIMKDVDEALKQLVNEPSKNGVGIDSAKAFEMADGSIWDPKNGKAEFRYNSTQSIFEDGFKEKDLYELVGRKKLDGALKFFLEKTEFSDYDFDYVLYGVRKVIEETASSKKGDEKLFAKEKNYLLVNKQFLNFIRNCMIYKLETEDQKRNFKNKYKEAKSRNEAAKLVAEMFKAS